MTNNTTTSPTTPPLTYPSHPDRDTPSILDLPDGRKLSYAQYGSPTGHAILYQHGLPGSRIEAAGYHALASEIGARIIAIDRPGMGQSTPYSNRTLQDWPKDLTHLTSHLGLDTYSVLGVSGGGPYALACAAFLPRDKLKCVCIVCGVGPPDISMKGADWAHWFGIPYGWRYAPAWMLWLFFQRDMFGRMDLSDEERLRRLLSPKTLDAIPHPKDRQIMGDEKFLRVSLRATREANAQGFKNIAQDGRIICSEWGFKVEDIRKDLPVKLWWGKDDTFVPANHGVQIAARLGGRAELRIEEETHASISQNWMREQLEGILNVMRGAS
jgi:pimeloyl-ACP methyl ester carboxylesterase